MLAPDERPGLRVTRELSTSDVKPMKHNAAGSDHCRGLTRSTHQLTFATLDASDGGWSKLFRAFLTQKVWGPTPTMESSTTYNPRPTLNLQLKPLLQALHPKLRH